jgi:hypothetical protein
LFIQFLWSSDGDPLSSSRGGGSPRGAPFDPSFGVVKSTL